LLEFKKGKIWRSFSGQKNRVLMAQSINYDPEHTALDETNRKLDLMLLGYRETYIEDFCVQKMKQKLFC
jgi:ABC-type Mn2+/Zn2+ transport system ATPase subunit